MTFHTHRVAVNGKVVFDGARQFYQVLRSKEWYRTEGFNEIAFRLVKGESYRESVDILNRVRRCTDDRGTPCRTMANTVEIEGNQVQECIVQLSEQILEANAFTAQGKPTESVCTEGIKPMDATLPPQYVQQAATVYNGDKEPECQIPEAAIYNFHEDPGKTVNIGIDDVGVKKQKTTRYGTSEDKEQSDEKKRVYNTIAKIEADDRKYVLNARSTTAILPILIAFLLNNQLLGRHFQFYVDGARSLQNAILATFCWCTSWSMILDWYHLEKKCKTELSLTIRTTKLRNAVLAAILPLLWLGKIDEAIAYLRSLPPEQYKPGRTVDQLIGYFERNRQHIPCYALRKQLGLRNSSNQVEKANDMAVATRQKHNGMSWSDNGSEALTTMTVLQMNKEHMHWFRSHEVRFRLVA
jgi:hypothetical protein